jgi:hypothetical protein
MVQLPSAARLSGNSRPALRGLLHRLQHAAGLGGEGQVGGVDGAHAVHALQAQQHLRAAGVGHAAAHQAGVAALRHDADALRGAGRTTVATSAVLPGRTTASARPCQRRRQSSSQADRSPSVSTWAAPTCGAASSAGRRSKLMPPQGAWPRRQPPADVHARRREQQQGTAHLGIASLPWPRSRWRAPRAFGEVQPDQQAQPAVGVHAVAQQAAARQQRQHLEASVPLPVGASHSSQARPSTIRPSRLPTASAGVRRMRRAHGGSGRRGGESV